MAMAIWIGAAMLYAAFRLWYDNWRGPLSPAEVDRIMAAMATRAATDHPSANNAELRDIFRGFLEADDGSEFVMLNLVKIAGQAPDPVTGAMTDGRSLMQRYSKPFVRALFARGGHPAFVARPAGGYVDAWNAAPDPGWSIVGLMRYRSRRDVAALVLDPRFTHIHPYKIAATPVTFSFPTTPMLRLFVGPRVWVGLTIALAAALMHIALRG
jgi:hypothetical protein